MRRDEILGVCPHFFPLRRNSPGDPSVTKRKTPHHGDYIVDTRMVSISAIAILLGLCATITARVLLTLIAIVTNFCFFGRLSAQPSTPTAHHFGRWIIALPAIGGIVIGYMARYGSDKIRGHGIPEAMEAILLGSSKVSWKVALLKPLSSAVSIGTGGPYGAEGPIIMTGGAIGSLIAQLFHLTASERKTLLVAGAAGGMTAIFGTPLAAVLLGIELLLFEWRPRSFIPVAAASLSAAGFRGLILSDSVHFSIAPHLPVDGKTLVIAAVAGLACGLLSTILSRLVYGFEDLFERLPIHWMWWPALGGLVVGVIGYCDPRILGVGYQNIEQLLSGRLLGAAVASLLIAKTIAWSLSLGSGTSGGVLAPLLIAGGSLGALIATLFGLHDAGMWCLIGMAGVMASSMRAPIASVLFAVELTRDLSSMPAILAACATAMAVTALVDKRSILTEKLARRGHLISCELGSDPLHTTSVADVMLPRTYAVSEASSPRSILGDPSAESRQAVADGVIPIRDVHGAVYAAVTLGELLEEPSNFNLTLGDLVLTPATWISADAKLSEAVSVLIRSGEECLLVHGGGSYPSWQGILRRADLIHAHGDGHAAESHRSGRIAIPDLRWVQSKGHSA